MNSVVPPDSFWSRLDCRRWLQIAGLSLAFAMIGLCSVQTAMDRRAAIQEAGRTTHLIAVTLASQIASDVALGSALADRAAALLAARSWDELSSSDTAAALRGWTDDIDRVDGIWLMDAAGVPRIASGRALATATLDAYAAVLGKQETDAAVYIGPAIEPGASRSLRIAVTRRVKAANGTLRGVALIIVRPAPMEQLAADSGDYPIAVQVVGADDAVVASFVLSGARSRMSQIERDDANPADAAVTARARIRDLPFSIAAIAARDAVDAEWHETALRRTALMLAFIAPIVLLGLFALSRNRSETATRIQLKELADGAEQRIRERTATIERLMNEVNHRAKNSLQMISALLRMHAQVAKDADVRNELIEARNRVMTIAHVHDRLYRSDQATRVKLDGLLEEVGEDLSPTLVTLDGAAIGLVVEADPAELAVDDAVPLILVMNELVASAVKHAFPGGRGGTIWVALTALENNGAILSVENDGVPVPEEDEGAAADLPMTLIRGLAGQIGGSLSHRMSERGGTRYEVKFSLQREKSRKRV